MSLPPAPDEASAVVDRRIAIRLAYEGTRYSGWQMQPGRATVQGTLATAIREVSGEEVAPKGASRTDAGVHALDQVAAFTSASGHSADVWVRALNATLPSDITVLEGREVGPDFDPVSAAVSKRYRYRIHDAAWRPVLDRHLVWHWRGRLDEARMREAATALIGEHDFTSFETVPSTRLSKVRTIHSLEVFRPPLATDAAGAEVWIEVEGNGFLYNMVRIIAGSLVLVGAGKRSPGWLGEALAARSRPAAGPTAPPQGLMLVAIDLGHAWPTTILPAPNQTPSP
ncbi:MAG: tRNA pseudouridine(38-40) synthase TruA [Planctomycetes bacterium]|nr:tRNA pseudouridine(38-40) synthase TruA [Planctomycetota bacterium]